jgi:hypothetical protein
MGSAFWMRPAIPTTGLAVVIHRQDVYDFMTLCLLSYVWAIINNNILILDNNSDHIHELVALVRIIPLINMADKDDLADFPDVSKKIAAPSKKSVFERQRAEAEAKRVRDEKEAAAIYDDFVKSFDDEGVEEEWTRYTRSRPFDWLQERI